MPPTASVPELAPYTFTATATDSDDPVQPLTFSLTGAPAGATIGASSSFGSSDTVLSELSTILRRLSDRAIEQARLDGRRTVMDRDFDFLKK